MSCLHKKVMICVPKAPWLSLLWWVSFSGLRGPQECMTEGSHGSQEPLLDPTSTRQCYTLHEQMSKSWKKCLSHDTCYSRERQCCPFDKHMHTPSMPRPTAKPIQRQNWLFQDDRVKLLSDTPPPVTPPIFQNYFNFKKSQIGLGHIK